MWIFYVNLFIQVEIRPNFDLKFWKSILVHCMILLLQRIKIVLSNCISLILYGKFWSIKKIRRIETKAKKLAYIFWQSPHINSISYIVDEHQTLNSSWILVVLIFNFYTTNSKLSERQNKNMKP